jgi:PEP-CTERM motif
VTNNGAAILWMSSSSPLAGRGRLTGFSFDSTETPAQLAGTFMGTDTGAGDPITTSYVYTQPPNPLTTLDRLNADGTRFVTTAGGASTQGVPEPATLGLLALGLAGMVRDGAGCRRADSTPRRRIDGRRGRPIAVNALRFSCCPAGRQGIASPL